MAGCYMETMGGRLTSAVVLAMAVMTVAATNPRAIAAAIVPAKVMGAVRAACTATIAAVPEAAVTAMAPVTTAAVSTAALHLQGIMSSWWA